MGDFAGELARCRFVAGLSMPALAKRAGLSTGAVSRLEAGKRHPSRETIAALIEGLALGEDADDDRQMRVRLYLAAGYVPAGWTVTGLRKVAA